MEIREDRGFAGNAADGSFLEVPLVGAELTREHTPYLPLTPEEIAQSGIAAVAAGASLLHLHVRDAQGKPTLDSQVISRVMELIRKDCPEVILQVSTGGAVGDPYETRMGVLVCKPEMASLTTGTTNFGDEVFLNPRPFVEKLAGLMRDKNIKPELEIFDLSMMEEGLRLIEKDWVKEPAHFQFVLGVPGALQAASENLNLLLSRLPKKATWSVAAVGRHQFPMVELAIQKGGHVRVGMEDNIYLEKGVLAKSNAELVEKAAMIIKQQGFVVAKPDQAREILSL
ncbi:MAG: 3-keto-5-aminohexanoate cleavage protein [Deltaproteobacteria bacterium]|nr:3-keto-5-aminohexanoate cleavage protein [Deltaproteobacteria bacterium]